MSLREDKCTLYAFHKIKDRTILPQSYYLKKVTNLYMNVKRKFDTILSYENLKFPNKAEIPSAGTNLDIDLRLLQGNGSFAFSRTNENEVFATGKIQIMDIPQLRSLERSIAAQSRKSENYVHYEGEDVLNFMDSHGYALENTFAVIKSVDVGENTIKAIVSWNGNMIAFLNGLLTLISFFHTKSSNAFHFVSEIQQLIVEFSTFSKSQTRDVDVLYDSTAGTLKCPGVMLFIPETREVDDTLYTGNTSFEVHRFVPYSFGEIGSGQSAVSICHQLIVENSLPPTDTWTTIKTICIGENLFSDGLSSMTKSSNPLQLSTVVSEQVLIEQEIPTISDEVLWVVSSKTIAEDTINKLRLVAPKCFVLMPAAAGTPKTGRMFQVFTFSSSYEEFALYSLPWCSAKTVAKVELNDNSLPALESMLIQANERNNQEKSTTNFVYLFGNVQSISSILGVLDETKKLPYHNLLRFFFGDGKENLDEYFGRINNELKMNLVWNGAWGSLRAFPGMSAGSNSALCNEPSLLYTLSNLVHSSEPTVLGLNLNDVTGSLDNDGVGAFDIVRCNTIGIGNYDPLNRVLVQDEILKWGKPRQWTNAEAATVPLLYSLAMNIIKLKNALPMETILVNQGLMLLSQAIIRLLQNEPVKVFVTVHGNEEKQQLLKLFPKLEPENIFYCSTTFHVDLLSKTKGFGVDKVVNTFEDPEMVKPCSYSADRLGTVIHVSMNPMVIKSTMGMLIFNDEIRTTGMSSETLLELPQAQKVEIRDALAKAINDGLVVPFVRTSIPQEATNVEAVKYLKSAQAKTKLVTTIENKLDSKKSVILNCSSDKHYVIVNDKSSKSNSWLELSGWLAKRGARNITVVLDDKGVTGLSALRTESLKHQYNSLNLTIKSMGELSSKTSVNNFITAVDARHRLSSVFILTSKNSTLIELINESLNDQACNCDLICIGCGGEKTCEERSNRGLKSLCVRVGADERDFKVVVESLDNLINLSKRNPIVTVKTLKAAESAVEKSHVPCNLAEIQNVLHLSAPCCAFKEILTTGPSIKYCKEVNPLFLFPGLQPQIMRKITPKLLYGAYELRLAKNMTSINDMAKDITDLMSSTGRNTYTLVAEGWGGILALHVAATLESMGKIVRLILIDAGPSDVIECARDLMKDPVSLISKYIGVTYEVCIFLLHTFLTCDSSKNAFSYSHLV